MRTGRIGPHSRQAHLRNVCGARLMYGAASFVGSTAGSSAALCGTVLMAFHLSRAGRGVDGDAIKLGYLSSPASVPYPPIWGRSVLHRVLNLAALPQPFPRLVEYAVRPT